MKRITLCVAIVVTTLTFARAGEVIDRIVAIVNGHVLLQSDWDDALCYEAFAKGQPLAQLSAQEREATLNRLIDQELLREQLQAQDLEKASPEAIQKRMQEIRSQHPDSTSDAAWNEVLAHYGLNEKKLEAHVAEELGVLHLIDVRLRPSVQVDTANIEAYYKDTFLPEMHKVGAANVPLSEVSARIREILTQQKVGELYSSWMQTLRNESKIRTNVPMEHPLMSAGGQGQ